MSKAALTTLIAMLNLELCGCAHLQPVRPGYNISSEGSDYSPTVRIAVAVPISTSVDGQTVVITIDTLIVSAQGQTVADTVLGMRELYITAILATRANQSGVAGALGQPWLELAESDSVLLLKRLPLGETRRLQSLSLTIPRPSALDPNRTWLVFRISGTVMTNEVRMADGRVFPQQRLPGHIRVFACADWTLAGFVDRRTADALIHAYTAAC